MKYWCQLIHHNVYFIPQYLMQQEKPKSRIKGLFKIPIFIQTKNLTNKAENQSTSESPVKKRLRKASQNLKSIQNIDLRRQISAKQSFDEQYEIEQKIGEGGHSVVYKCRDLKSDQIYAVKVTRKNDPQNFQSLKQQYRILTSLDHDGVLKGHYLFLNQKKSTCHLVCQYCDYPNLREYLVERKNGPINQHKACEIIKSVLQVVHYLHQQRVSHRDLKPQNILYDPDTCAIKIIDFQVAKMPRYTHEKLEMWTKTGTPSYRSPQLLQGSYNQLTDMWSLGIITYEMLVGKFPFKASYEKDLYNCIINFAPNFQNSSLSQIAKNFVQKLLKRDPKERMSAKQALSHPFILSLTIITPINSNYKKLNSSFEVDQTQEPGDSHQEQKTSPKSKFYDQNVKLTFLSNIDKDIGIRFCED